MGWAYKFSPYTGAAFAVHLALADVANDVNGFEIWARQRDLGMKARVRRQGVSQHIGSMIEDGFLEQLEDNAAKGEPNRYRFLFPDVPLVFGWGVSAERTGVSATATGGVRLADNGNRTEPKELKDTPVGDADDPTPEVGMRVDGTPLTASKIRGDDYPKSFQDCWTAYMRSRRGGKGDAYRAWRATVVRLKESGLSTGQALDGILRATKVYMAQVESDGRNPDMVKLAATFWGVGRHVETAMDIDALVTEVHHAPIPSWMRQRLEG